MRFEERPEYVMGQQSEELFARKMQVRGWAVLPTCDLTSVVKETKAPVLYAPNGGISVTPDALIFRDGKSCWTEIKGKTEPTWRIYPPGPRWEHGIDYDLVGHYLDVQESTDLRVYLVVHERKTPGDPRRQSDLVAADVWLRVSLADAQVIGERRTEWPGGKSAPSRRGRGGLGGWLWARDAMEEITW
jgi:hypothetical protein